MAEKIKLGTSGNWGVKENGVLGFNDENGVFKAIELASSRSSGATYVGEDGLIKDAEVGVPRIDWTNGVGELLLEPQRTNIIPYSEDFSNAAWIKGSSTINANQVISPDGTLNADLIVTSAAGGGVSDGIGGSGDYSFSVFAKYKDIQFIRLRSTSSYAWFDIENGSVGTTISALDATIENYGNGWYRCTLVGNNTNTLVQVTCTEQNGANVGFGSVYLWGAQVEAGSYPTSYIRTSGTTVTRIADAVTLYNIPQSLRSSNDNFITVYFEYNHILNVTSNAGIRFSGSSGSLALLGYFTNSGARVFFFDLDDGTRVFSTQQNFEQAKVAFSIDNVNLNVRLYINGSQVKDVSIPSKATFDELLFGLGDAFRTKELKVYDTALTDAELTTLTTI